MRRYWISSSTGIRRTRFRARLMLFAILPTLLFLGHAIVPGEANQATDRVAAHQSEQDGAEHARHCHEQIGSCADQPLTSGPGQLLQGQQIQPSASLGQLRITPASFHIPAGYIAIPLDPPPQSTVA